jgi:hypothetical protein
VEEVALIRRVFVSLVTKMMDRFLEQQINIKFCNKLENNASSICAVFSKADGGGAMKNSSVFEWHKRFKEGHENVDDDESSGRPKSHKIDENVEKVRHMVH